MFDVAESKYTVEAYFELEKISEIRHEFYYGKLIPMAGESKNANKITNNCLKLLAEPLEKRKLELFTHDVRLIVKQDGIYRYPDLAVAPESDDEDTHAITQPVMIVEVISSSTAGIDRGPKIREYCSMPTLQHYLILEQTQVAAELYSRQGNEKEWRFTIFSGPEDVIELPALGVSFTLGELYQKVKLSL
ncbi:MAG: Uma2 family endonuclease [Saprospiraceae bacterium]|nr:Uma2 family endonuclease [Saprospiraceae bacterium]MCF8248935.1 Uma2 family endonuclease [Saprospiraceae bacterium]MCF8279146.1 Uma2 family endonuclease [Bacteroidales bacterium]MCF8310829.1 Uma2 family endonuclease [Saprospiraceae bacterium]MCF8439583.1 Uma2 family endonuclease [Saprospiraceae bacterium]